MDAGFLTINFQYFILLYFWYRDKTPTGRERDRERGRAKGGVSDRESETKRYM